MRAATVRLAVVGCGDVLFRSYLPGLEAATGVEMVGFVDLDGPRTEKAVQACASWSPAAVAHKTLEGLLQHVELDAILNLTPAPQHAAVTRQALQSGAHVFTEKPIALTLEEALELRDLAQSNGRLLQCAPAVMAAPRFRWLAEVVGSAVLGTPTLACAHFANLGPAALPDYSGDPSVHYGELVGPLLDQGVYVLHAIVGVLGHARRVQAFGATAIAQRTVLSGPRGGKQVEVTSADHVLVHLELESGALATVLSSFAVPATRTPTLEIHCTGGSFSLEDPQHANAPVSVYPLVDLARGLAGWIDSVRPRGPRVAHDDLIALGPVHFVEVIHGLAKPLLGADEACHVLEIALAAAQSIREGRVVELDRSDLSPTPSHA